MKIKPQMIVATSDFSPCSAVGLRLAASLAASYDAELFIVNIISDKELQWLVGDEAPKKPVDIVAAEQRDRLMEHFRRSVGVEEWVPVKVRGMIGFGHPAEEIIKIAEDLKADLIVMATHGRTGLRHILAGSVTEEVVRKAPCPVLTMRPREGEDLLASGK